MLHATMTTAIVLSLLLGAQTAHSAILDPNDKVIVGYWHNFSNGSSDIRLIDIPEEYNVVNVSFIENKPGSQVEVFFTPYETVYPDENLFISDVAALKAQGRRVQISIGGQNGHIVLNSEADKNTFVSQTIAICEKYGFNGLDIDLEGASIGMVQSADFTNPTNPQFLLFNQAVDEILNHFGSSFWLTAAPEIYYVQAAKGVYGGGAVGAYLPFLYHFRDRIDILHVQLYNASSEWTEYGTFSQSSADHMVYMCDLLIKGFTVGNGAGKAFPPFPPSKIAIGKPSGAGAAGSGISSLSDIADALNYLVNGESFGGAYPLAQPGGYPDFRGIMTWSINWDQTTNYAFAKNAFSVLNGGQYVCTENCSSSATITPSSTQQLSSSSEVITTSSISLQSSQSENTCDVDEYQNYPAIYQQGDRVQYNGTIYESLTDNLYNVVPDQSVSHYWQLIGSDFCIEQSSDAITTFSSSNPVIASSSSEIQTTLSSSSEAPVSSPTEEAVSSSYEEPVSSSESIAVLNSSSAPAPQSSSSENVADIAFTQRITHQNIQLFNSYTLQNLKAPPSSKTLTVYDINGNILHKISLNEQTDLSTLGLTNHAHTLIAVFK